MAIYKISFSLKADAPPYRQKTTTVLRELPGYDIDNVWHKLELKCQEKWGRNLIAFDCVMISKRSADYRSFLAARDKKKNPPSFSPEPEPPEINGHQHPFAREEYRRKKS